MTSETEFRAEKILEASNHDLLDSCYPFGGNFFFLSESLPAKQLSTPILFLFRIILGGKESVSPAQLCAQQRLFVVLASFGALGPVVRVFNINHRGAGTRFALSSYRGFRLADIGLSFDEDVIHTRGYGRFWF